MNRFTLLNNTVRWATNWFVVSGWLKWTQLTWDTGLTWDDIKSADLPVAYRKCMDAVKILCDGYDELPERSPMRDSLWTDLLIKLNQFRNHYKDYFEYVVDKWNFTNITKILKEFQSNVSKPSDYEIKAAIQINETRMSKR